MDPAALGAQLLKATTKKVVNFFEKKCTLSAVGHCHYINSPPFISFVFVIKSFKSVEFIMMIR